MLKLEVNEVATLLAMLNQAQKWRNLLQTH